MTDTDHSSHGFEVRTDTEAEKMTVQIRLRGSGHDWHALSRYQTGALVDQLDSAIWQLRKVENERRLPSAKRVRYRELLKALAGEQLDETELDELRELDRAVRAAGIDVFKEMSAAFVACNSPEAPALQGVPQ